MGNLPQTRILEEAAECFKIARKGLFKGIQLLYRIREENLWEGAYSSFNDYVEGGLGISKAQVSRYLTSYEHFVVKGGVEHAQLSDIEPDKLYIALKLPGTPEEQVIKAETLTRSELKQELAVRDGKECEHLTTITICANCHVRIS